MLRRKPARTWPRHPTRGGESERLVVLGGDGAIAILDGEGAAAFRLFDALRVGAALGGERVGDVLHEGDALLQYREGIRAHVAGHAAPEAVFALDRVARDRGNPALAAVAEGHLALDRVAEVMARARLAVEEALHLVPADPGTGAIRVRLDRLGSFLSQDDPAVGGRGRVGLQDPELGPGEDGSVREREALVDRAIGRAEHFFHGDSVDRVHRVHQHGAQDGRQVPIR